MKHPLPAPTSAAAADWVHSVAAMMAVVEDCATVSSCSSLVRKTQWKVRLNVELRQRCSFPPITASSDTATCRPTTSLWSHHNRSDSMVPVPPGNPAIMSNTSILTRYQHRSVLYTEGTDHQVLPRMFNHVECHQCISLYILSM